MARIHRWQLLIAFLGALLLIGVLGLASYNYTPVLVPTYGGTYREGMAGAPRYLNPLLASFNLVDEDITSLLFRGLGRFDDHGRVVPDLAAGWDVSPDARTYTIRLADGLRWHDGAPLTIEDVLFTYKTLQDEDFPGDPALKRLWQSVLIEKIDAQSVRFVLAEPFAPFLDQLTIGLLPKHLWQQVPVADMPMSPLNVKPVGNGPFVVTATSPLSLTLQWNPFSSGPKPYIDAVGLRFYPDDASVLEAYQRGEIDAFGRVQPVDLPTLTQRKDTRLFFSPQPSYTILLPNLQNPNVPFFQDKAVRQALMYGLDREALIKKDLNGMGIVAHSPIMPNNWAYTDDIPQYTFDPQKARALLEQAGWRDEDGDGVREKGGVALRFILLGDDTPESVRMLTDIAAFWKDIGVEALPRPVTFAGLVRDFLEPRTFEMALVPWRLSGDPDPYPLWHSTQAKEGGQNYAGWMNPSADALMEEARRTPDLNRRIPLYHQFQQIFADELPGLPLYHPMYGFAIRDRIKNVTIGPLYNPADRYRTFPNWYIRLKRVPARAVTPTP